MNIKIDTLSQIHIGNGNYLQVGNDFIADGNYIFVLNLDKLGAVIGTGQTIIQQWVEAIARGESENFIKNRIKNTPYMEISKRRIESSILFNKDNTLKEHIHDGFGRPYIPGSSIKGAIRTAVMSTYAKKTVEKRLKKEDKRKWKKIIFGMENELLHFDTGDKQKKKNSLSNDLFRFFSTGDAYFNKGVEIAVKQINLNITEQESLLDEKKKQAIEVIKKGVSSQFRMKVTDDFYQRTSISNILDLFKLINNHTYQLIRDEIEFWGKSEGSIHTGQDCYIEQLEIILDVIDTCPENECVLRIGQASGWRFITGAWLERIDKSYFKDAIVPLCRPHNFNYERYPFPKSRRIDESSNLFGFVKLTFDS